MNPDERLAGIVTALEAVGLTYLVMGGHAVRFHGLERNTIDFDFHLGPGRWDDLPEVLSRTTLFSRGPVVEGKSWRPRPRQLNLGVDGDVETICVGKKRGKKSVPVRPAGRAGG